MMILKHGVQEENASLYLKQIEILEVLEKLNSRYALEYRCCGCVTDSVNARE